MDIGRFDTLKLKFLKMYPLLGVMFSYSRVMFTKAVPTAGVSVTNRINIMFNPDFIFKQTDDRIISIFLHEMLHVIHYHKFENELDKKIIRKMNVAMDVAINQYIPELENAEDYKDFATYRGINERYAASTGEELESMREWQYYFDKIKDVDLGNGNGTLDEHDCEDLVPGDGSEVTEEFRKKVITETLKKSLEQAKTLNKGNSTGNDTIENLVKSIINAEGSTINWKVELRNFIQRTMRADRQKTRKKPNRRYGILNPGSKIHRKQRLIVCIDESGSVGDEAWVQFFQEIYKIDQQKVDISIIHLDTEASKLEKFDPKKEQTRQFTGGTDYTPAIKKALQESPDGIIFFGDGGTFIDPDLAAKTTFPVSFLWVLTQNGEKPYLWGREVRLKVD